MRDVLFLAWVGFTLAAAGCRTAPPAREAEPVAVEGPPAVVGPKVEPAGESRVEPEVARPVVRPPPKPPTPSPPPPPLKPETEVAALVCPPDDPVSGREHYMAGIDALQVGNETGARKSLWLALCKTPGNKTAESLLKQIDEPLAWFFGEEYKEYTVQWNDTLSKIARRFYGDPFLFYALARYNGIENPSRLEAGQSVRIPFLSGAETLPEPEPTPIPEEPSDMVAPSVSAIPAGGTYSAGLTVALSAVDNIDPQPVMYYTLDGATPHERSNRYRVPLTLTSDTTLRFLAMDTAGNASEVFTEYYVIPEQDKFAEIQDWAGAGEYEKAVSALEEALAEDSEDPEAQELLIATCMEYASLLRGEGRLGEAQEILQRASARQPKNEQIAEQLRVLEREIGVERIYENGVRAAEEGELEKAYSRFSQVLELSPEHAPAEAKLMEVRDELVEGYSKEAMAAFRKQDLDGAIRRWEKVLEVDPTNELAKLRRAEAVDLKVRFEEKFE